MIVRKTDVARLLFHATHAALLAGLIHTLKSKQIHVLLDCSPDNNIYALSPLEASC